METYDLLPNGFSNGDLCGVKEAEDSIAKLGSIFDTIIGGIATREHGVGGEGEAAYDKGVDPFAKEDPWGGGPRAAHSLPLFFEAGNTVAPGHPPQAQAQVVAVPMVQAVAVPVVAASSEPGPQI